MFVVLSPHSADTRRIDKLAKNRRIVIVRFLIIDSVFYPYISRSNSSILAWNMRSFSPSGCASSSLTRSFSLLFLLLFFPQKKKSNRSACCRSSRGLFLFLVGYRFSWDRWFVGG